MHHRRRKHRRRSRGHRGMAMVLVLLLIVLVSAAGIFAAQSAALDIRSSGFIRQAGQTHYVAESGIVAAMEEMRRFCSAYYRQMQIAAASTTTPAGLAEAPLQHRFAMTDFNTRTLTGGMFATPASGMGGRTPGSLGIGRLAPNFVTTVTALGLSATPTRGFDSTGGRSYRPEMLSMEFASEARTSLLGVTDNRNNAVSVEQVRAIAQIPCL